MSADVRIVEGNLVVTPGRFAAHMSALDWLQEELGLPEGFLLRLFAEQRIHVQGRPLSAGQSMPAHGKVWLLGTKGQSDARVSIREMDALPDASVLYEDEHIVVLDKPTGLLIHSDGSANTDTLQARLNQYLAANDQYATAMHVHRLDRDTTGCVLFAKHQFAARTLDAMMSKRMIHRHYLAVVCGRPERLRGVIDAPIGRDRHRSGAYRVSETGKSAVTHYEVVSNAETGDWGPTRPDAAVSSDGDLCNQISLVSCTLDTGRTHQVRVHLAFTGCPIVGDCLYGGQVAGAGWTWSGSGFALHGKSLVFQHPYTKEVIQVDAPLPEPFHQLRQRTGLAQ